MVNVLWTGIFLTLIPISFAHDDRRIKRAVFDIIPKHDYQDQTVRNRKESRQRKTVRRVSIPVNTENYIQQKSEQIKKLDLKLKAIELDQEKINDEQLLLNLRGRGSKFKTDNSVKIFCFLTTLFVFSTTIVQLKIY